MQDTLAYTNAKLRKKNDTAKKKKERERERKE